MIAEQEINRVIIHKQNQLKIAKNLKSRTNREIRTSFDGASYLSHEGIFACVTECSSEIVKIQGPSSDTVQIIFL